MNNKKLSIDPEYVLDRVLHHLPDSWLSFNSFSNIIVFFFFLISPYYLSFKSVWVRRKNSKNLVKWRIWLKSAKILRTKNGYKQIYINPDLTESERIMDHELRVERNKLNANLDQNSPFRFGIRGNDIVKVKKQ